MTILINNWHSFGAVAVGAFLYGFYLYFAHPLSRYPGPLLAKFTDYWRFQDVRGRQSHLTMIRLHEKYGPLVRTGPNTLSIADPAYIPKIYGPGHGFLKSAFYLPFQGWVGNTIGYNLFTTRDAHYHSAIKQPVANAYGMKSALEFEPIVDDCIVKFVRRLDDETMGPKGKKACDLAAWMQYYAFDVIAIMTWGKPFGFLDRGKDVDNMISRLDKRLDQIAPMPWIDWLKTKNWVVNLFRDKTNGFAIFTAALIEDRRKEMAQITEQPGPRLFIDRFFEAQRTHPSVVDDRTVVIYTTSNVMAGSDTVAITLRAIFYMVLRDNNVRRRLVEEIDAAGLSFPVTWEESQRLPYMNAVIQESLRIHPPVGHALERVVPTDGLTMLDGMIIPSGCQVGVHPWAVHHIDPIWGTNPKKFKPERWLQAAEESAEEYQNRVAAMKRASLAFGAGSRGCMGRHLSIVQIAKLVPSIFMKFRFDLVDESRDWEVVCSWFVRQSRMDVFIGRR
ncbi:hypothetical protein TruAng_003177 [Truncatella angustata]|nr:hypothetical protein TruAng_003177 [Truncatella angustata]